MSAFRPCLGRDLCMEDAHGCRVCGRSREEIDATRRGIDALADIALRYGYDNIEEFTAWVAHKLEKKIHARRARA